MATDEMCACGQPLHYSDPQIQNLTEQMNRALGSEINVVTSGGTFAIPRHYIALHGLKEQDVPALAAKYNFRRVDN